MPNHTEHFSKRIQSNLSEEIFINYCKERSLHYIPYGLDDSHWSINRFVRNTPDYIVRDNDGAFFVEVKGCYRDLGLKTLDLKSYKKWNKLMDLYFFFYAKERNEIKIVSYKKIEGMLSTCDYGNYHDISPTDDKTYAKIMWDLL